MKVINDAFGNKTTEYDQDEMRMALDNQLAMAARVIIGVLCFAVIVGVTLMGSLWITYRS